MHPDPFIPDNFVVKKVFQPIVNSLKRWTTPQELAESMLTGSFVLLAIWCINVVANTYVRDGLHNTMIVGPILLVVILATGALIWHDYKIIVKPPADLAVNAFFCSKRLTLLIAFVFMLITNDRDFFYSVMTCFWVPLWSAGLYFISCEKPPEQK
jgi:hypothetical protein